MIHELVEKYKLKERAKIVKNSSPDRKWTDEKITTIMEVYNTDGGSKDSFKIWSESTICACIGSKI